MKLLYSLLLAIACLMPKLSISQDPDCGNNHKRSPDYCPCTKCDTKSGDPFDPYTGNEHREVRDLEVWGTVGEIPLVWMRYSNSRYGSFYKYIYGDGSNWNSSFNYNMSDAGLNAQGRPQVFIHYPEGGGVYFFQSPGISAQWLPLSAINEKLFQDGNNFYLQMANGHRYHFQRMALPGGNHYQLQDIRDNYQNVYRLTYDRYGFLSRVTEPAGRYLAVSYRVVASTYYLVDQVSSSDGRSVKYNYDVYDDSVAKWVRLVGVDYGDGTKALYTYSQTKRGLRPSLEHAIDPRYNGTDVDMRFTYDSSNAWGFIKEEINGVTGKVMVTLKNEVGKRTVCYANGRVQVYSVPGELMGLMKEYTDGLGRKIQYSYNGSSPGQGGPGLLNSETDALGRTTVYNQRTIYGNLLEVTYADGSKEKWTRDTLDQILTHTDELGRVTTYTRDARNRVTRIDYPDATRERFTYNTFGEVLTHTLRNGAVETNTYDNRGLKTSFTDALGNITQYTYDIADKLASTRDARGNTTRNEYNERGLLTKSINADGSFQLYSYDDFGNQITKTNEIGNTWLTSYDEFKRPDSTTDPLGRLTLYQYDLPNGACGCAHDNNKPTSITLAGGKVTKVQYDVEWQKISETAGDGTPDAATTYYEYDLAGNLSTVIDPRMKSWVTEYDVRNRKKSYTDPLGHKTQWVYDFVGNILQVIRPDMGSTTNQYDVMNRLTQVTDPKGQVVKMNYDADGNIVRLIDANNRTYTYTYDLLDRKTSLGYPGSIFERYTYDPAGNMATYTNRSGNVRTYSYDSRNRELSAVWSDNTPAVYNTYDNASRLMSESNSVSTLSYTYDKADELTSETQNIAGSSGARTVKYTYNADGLKSSLTYPNGDSIYYTYNGRNLLFGILKSNAPVALYKYDLNGNRINKDLNNGANTVYAYDDANNLLLVDNRKANVSFSRFEYGYNTMNNRIYVKRDASKGDTYQYDAIDQITGVRYEVTDPGGASSNPVRTVAYDWDSVGNRRKVTDNGIATDYITNNRNEYTRVGSVAVTNNSNGDIRTYNGWTYTYDAQDRLITATKGSSTVSFNYDAANRCVKRIINNVTTFFYYDAWNLINEVSAPSGLSITYTYGQASDEIINSVRSGIAGVNYYHHNALGNVVNLTNSIGNIIERYTYDVFGTPIIKDAAGNTLTASSVDNRFMYTGRELIKEAGLYDYRNRMYSAEIGRFIQPDPLRFGGDDYNLFRYVQNNPVNWIDPTGEIKFGDFGKILDKLGDFVNKFNPFDFVSKNYDTYSDNRRISDLVHLCEKMEAAGDCRHQCGANRVVSANHNTRIVQYTSKSARINLPCGWACQCCKK